MKDLIFVIVKKHLPLQFVESSWLKTFDMHLCSRIVFPSKK
jgi:hypothetical protein